MAELAAEGWGVTPEGALVLSGMDFAGYDPLSIGSLRQWFEDHGQDEYLRKVRQGLYTTYPPGIG